MHQATYERTGRRNSAKNSAKRVILRLLPRFAPEQVTFPHSGLFPEWVVASLEARVELLDAEPRVEPCLEAAPLLPMAVDVYGCMHLLDNVPKGFSDKLLHWKAFHGQLHQCATLLRSRSRRQRYVHTCLGVDNVNARMFEEFSAQLLDHRWFSVFAFVSSFLPLLPILQQTWQTQAYQTGVDSGTVADKEFDAELFAGTLKDPLFHCYCSFIHKLGKLLLHMARWLEGCPCHGPRPKKRSAWRCPLGGCRAPQLAAGALQEVMLAKYEANVAEVLSYLVQDGEAGDPDLQQKNHSTLATDVALARAHIHFSITLKMDAWQRLPLVLAALAHPCVTLRQLKAQEILGAFDGYLAEGAPLEAHHPLARLFLAEGLSWGLRASFR